MQIGRAHLSPRKGTLYALRSLSLLWAVRSSPVWMSFPLGKRTGLPVTRGILASRSRNPSVSRPLLEAVLLWQDQTLPLSILLDSGADENFIDR